MPPTVMLIHVTVSNTVAVVQSFAACDSDINDWMRVSRQPLKTIKTQVMWLG